MALRNGALYATCTFIVAFSLTILSSQAIGATKNSSTKKKEVAAQKVSVPKIQLMRPWELKKLGAGQKLQYYRALQTLIAALEKASVGKKPEKSALYNLFIEKTFASSQAGDECVIGGYISTWAVNSSGRLSCSAPTGEQLFDAPAPREFFCGTSSTGERQGYCNSAVFLFADDTNKRFCQPLQNLSSNCAKAFEARYAKAQGDQGDPHFPERLVRDFDRFAKSTTAQELDNYLSDYDKFLDGLIKDNTFDAATAAIIKKQVGIMANSRDLLRAFPDAAPVASAPAAPADTSAATPGAAPVASKPVDNSTAQPAPSANAAITPANYTGPGDDDPTNDPDPKKTESEGGGSMSSKAPSDESKLLGKELTCVRDGLVKLGYKPSERFLALIGIGVQAANGAYDSNQETTRDVLRSRVISMVQAYGFCDESSYPSNKLKNNDLNLTRRWLTADSGRASPKLGMQYLIQMNDPKTQAATTRAFYDVFGLRTETKNTNPEIDKKKKMSENIGDSVEDAFHTVFVQSEKEWNEQTLADRQSHIHDWTKPKVGSDFEGCHKNANERRTKDDSFRLQALRLPPAGNDGKRPPLSEERKTEIAKVTQANYRVCEAMTEACGLDAKKICEGGSGPQTQATIETTSKNSTAPKPAPAAQKPTAPATSSKSVVK